MTNGPIPGGLLIAVEGIDGAGKTTLAHALGECFRLADVPVTVSKEPTQGPWGSMLRASAAEGRLSPEEELRLLLLDRRQHVADLIQPGLDDRAVVILDRYYPSTAAYQGAVGLDVDDLLAQNSFAPEPDLVLLLDLEPEEGLRRIRSRGDVPNHFETAASLAACREIFLTMHLPTRVVVDARQSAEKVLQEAWRLILVVAAKKVNRTLGFSEAAGSVLLQIGRGTP